MIDNSWECTDKSTLGSGVVLYRHMYLIFDKTTYSGVYCAHPPPSTLDVFVSKMKICWRRTATWCLTDQAIYIICRRGAMLVQPTTTQTQTEGRMERLHLALYNLSDFYVLLTLCHVSFSMLVSTDPWTTSKRYRIQNLTIEDAIEDA